MPTANACFRLGGTASASDARTPSTVATILVAVIGSLLMGLYANRPIAVAPYMGENAFIAFGLASLGIGWQLRLGAVMVSGLLFLVVTLARVRGWLAASISPTMKHAFAVGIGLCPAPIGLYEPGIVTSFGTGMPAAALSAPGSELLRAPDVPLKIGDVDYRLAPEHCYPAAHDDCFTVYENLAGAGKQIVLIGESSGGVLALATMLRARQAGLPQPLLCTLISPIVDYGFKDSRVWNFYDVFAHPNFVIGVHQHSIASHDTGLPDL